MRDYACCNGGSQKEINDPVLLLPLACLTRYFSAFIAAVGPKIGTAPYVVRGVFSRLTYREICVTQGILFSVRKNAGNVQAVCAWKSLAVFCLIRKAFVCAFFSCVQQFMQKDARGSFMKTNTRTLQPSRTLFSSGCWLFWKGYQPEATARPTFVQTKAEEWGLLPF